MKKMLSKLLGKLFLGAAIGSIAFVLMLLIGSAIAGSPDAFIANQTAEGLVESAICIIVISIGYFVPSLIYAKENISIAWRVFIHMCIGTLVYLVTAYFAGWMKESAGALMVIYGLTASAIGLVIGFAVKFCLMRKAAKMNRKIKEKQSADSKTPEADADMGMVTDADTDADTGMVTDADTDADVKNE